MSEGRGFSRAAATIGALILLAPTLSLEAASLHLAQTLWTAKHAGGIDRLYFLLREPWLERPTGRGVTVAVIDTGVDPDHPDLRGRVVGWRDFVHGKPQPYDDNGHGTHVAAILAGSGHLQLNPLSWYWVTGLRGVAPDARLLVAKAMRHDGTGDDVLVARAIRWALDPNGDGDTSDGASIINLSVGLAGGAVRLADGPSAQAIRDAIRAGAVVVVSSGNDGRSTTSAPADLPGLLVVGALTPAGQVASFSNFGPEVDVGAPGVLISAFPGALDGRDLFSDGYVGMAGTSMAAPFVSGVVALMMEADPSLKRTSLRSDQSGKVHRIEAIVVGSARPIDSDRAGAGAVDAYGAVRIVDRGTDRWDPVFLTAISAALAGVGLAMRPRRSPVPNPAAGPASRGTD